MSNISSSDIGTIFQITVQDETGIVDLSSATTKKITFIDRNSRSYRYDAEFVTDGTDGLLQYTTSAAFIYPGWYKVYVYIEFPGSSFTSTSDRFLVRR